MQSGSKSVARSREVIAELRANGWCLMRQRGSHLQFKHPDRPQLITVPHPKKDLPIGTLKSIRRTAGLD